MVAPYISAFRMQRLECIPFYRPGGAEIHVTLDVILRRLLQGGKRNSISAKTSLPTSVENVGNEGFHRAAVLFLLQEFSVLHVCQLICRVRKDELRLRLVRFVEDILNLGEGMAKIIAEWRGGDGNSLVIRLRGGAPTLQSLKKNIDVKNYLGKSLETNSISLNYLN